MTVTYRLDRTGWTPHEVVEVLLTASCPTCGADWTTPRAALPRGSNRGYLCAACGNIHDAVEVDAQGVRVDRRHGQPDSSAP